MKDYFMSKYLFLVVLMIIDLFFTFDHNYSMC